MKHRSSGWSGYESAMRLWHTLMEETVLELVHAAVGREVGVVPWCGEPVYESDRRPREHPELLPWVGCWRLTREHVW